MRQERIRRIAALKDLITPLLVEHQALTDGAVDDKGEQRGFNSEEFEKHTRLATEISNLNHEIQHIETEIQAIDSTEREHDQEADRQGLGDREQLHQNSQEYRETFAQAICGGGNGRPDVEAVSRLNELLGGDYQNLTGQAPSTGEVLIPTVIAAQIMMEAENSSAILRVSDVSQTSNLIQSTPFLSELGIMAPRDQGEAYVRSLPTITPKNRKIYNFGLMFAVAQELREDVPALERALSQAMGRAAGYTAEEYLLKGENGQDTFFDQAGNPVTLPLANKVPLGILNEPAANVADVPTTTSGELTYEDFIQLKQAVHESADANGIYILSRAAETAALLLKDNDGRPLWSPSMVAGTPASINGRPYQLSSRLGNVVTGQNPMIYGDFQAAHKVDVKKNWTLKTSEHFYFGSGMIAYASDMRMGAITTLQNFIAKSTAA